MTVTIITSQVHGLIREFIGLIVLVQLILLRKE